jgi:glycosyltransferase involved in cell wall biosynthesis
MPEILILCEYPTLSGGERSMLATLDGVARAGFVPVVAAPQEGPLAETLAARGIELVGLATLDPSGGHRPQTAVREELACLLAKRRPSLFHANSLAMGRLSGPVTQSLRIPSLVHLRDILRLSRQAIADLNCHTRLLAVSEAVRHYHTAGGLAEEKTFVLHNGVDLERFRPRPRTGYLHEELGISPGVPLVVAIGQIGIRKGFDVLLRAAVGILGAAHGEPAKVAGTLRVPSATSAQGERRTECACYNAGASQQPGAHYLLVGQRWSDKAESRRFEADLHHWATARLGGLVHFLGLRTDVDRILCEATVLVHPARQEPLGRVLLEAAASGAAIVATDVGGTREIFPPESQTARLVPPDEPELLADAMLELLGDGPLRAQLGAAAHHCAVAAFSAEKATAGLVDHYRQVSNC